MEEALEIRKKSSAHANGMNEWTGKSNAVSMHAMKAYGGVGVQFMH